MTLAPSHVGAAPHPLVPDDTRLYSILVTVARLTGKHGFMKLERVSEHIWSLKTWVLIPVH